MHTVDDLVEEVIYEPDLFCGILCIVKEISQDGIISQEQSTVAHFLGDQCSSAMMPGSRQENIPLNLSIKDICKHFLSPLTESDKQALPKLLDGAPLLSPVV